LNCPEQNRLYFSDVVRGGVYRRTPEGEIVEAKLQDIEAGNGVAVFGPFSPDGRTLVADAVVVLPR